MLRRITSTKATSPQRPIHAPGRRQLRTQNAKHETKSAAFPLSRVLWARGSSLRLIFASGLPPL